VIIVALVIYCCFTKVKSSVKMMEEVWYLGHKTI